MKRGVTYVIPSDALYPRDEQHRLRIYAREGDTIRVIAATDAEGLGPALIQLDDDERVHGRRLSDLGAIGVLDTLKGSWLVLPWQRPDIPVTFDDAARGAISVEGHRGSGR